MTPADLDFVLGWARDEGWNPGLDDAAAFLAADPEGFLVCEHGGEPAVGLSIVRFDPAHAFLGLFICRRDLRGRGFGRALWRAGLERLAPATVGLDGVPSQQENYALSGFLWSHRTTRFTGIVGPPPRDPTIPLDAASLAAALALDRAVTGFDRTGFMRDWLKGAPTRRARALIRDGALAGFGAIRACVSGWKVGPMVAERPADAAALLEGLAIVADGAPISLDAPEPNAAAAALARSYGLAPSFETARMWRGPAPSQDLARTYAVATLELG